LKNDKIAKQTSVAGSLFFEASKVLLKIGLDNIKKFFYNLFRGIKQ
jgi:hypothetical protein